MYDNERITHPRVGEIILYTVNKGDNVYRLAQTFRSDVAWIKALNNLDDDFLIHPNQELLIPSMFQHTMPQPYQRASYDLYF